jgi:hypothetical protein
VSDAALPRILADPGRAALWEAVLAELSQLGPYEVRYRKAAVQVVRPDAAGVLAVHPDLEGLAVTLLLEQAVTSPRITSSQQVSPGLWHQRLRLSAPADVDDEFRGWLGTAYRRA